MLRVTLITHTPDPERIIASAAKLCYSSSSINEISSNLTDEKINSFVKMLSEIGHESPIEHISFTFGIEGVSRALLAQLTRHRIASYSVQSQRYVRENNFKYVIPPEVEANEEAKKEFIKSMQEAEEHYEKIAEILKRRHKESLVKSGIDDTTAEKISEKKSIEDARFVLPNACETKIICTFNARSLLNFFTLRCCNRAQWEIKELAIEMLRVVLNVAPNIFSKAGPPCVRGRCTEGKMSCGKIQEVREFFKSLREEQTNERKAYSTGGS